MSEATTPSPVAAVTASSDQKRGRLFLVPAPLDFGCEQQAPLEDALPRATIGQAAQLSHWICENAKSTRAYLKRVDAIQALATPIQAQQITELPREVHKKGDHGDKGAPVFDARPLLAAALQGHDMGLVSEAGMPAVADPGSSIVRAAHDLEIPVVPLVGPVSLLLALAASGMNGQNFAFVGYLPQSGQERTQRIRELESFALKTGQTQVFIETPYRNAALWQALTQTLQTNTRLAMAAGLTLESAKLCSLPVKQWRQREAPVDNRTPTVFLIGR
ncbi:16S rRNA (cytidine1402-2'-O)-methyltransferase [Acidovorax temperans]|uniref:16S rRNA (Cytidine1402-2'-O)-methyltransferase n=1 Tax=Acidovorax temperans TaxID=80878 RepID=A0A543L8T0_9BURK|nr:SAM-dependent methyltransferase [Acidovorax temperans]TQN03846.1 16S rRNA (cytidine1402-2'-O)-methyltransferase [Acidovorax temperans]